MSKNKNLHSAKKEKNDEFYTLYEDIEKEVEEYKDQLKDKIIFCNCDDPESSNFWKYLSNNFTYYGLKKLISSHYNPNGNSYKLEISRDNITQKIPFVGNGDFRSDECIEILKECDIVITNPSFSLFREYIAQLMEYDKKFLVIGSYNAITYKEVFGFIKENKLWLGVSPRSMNFKKSDGSIDVVNACWFTNLDNRKRHIDLIRDVLSKKYYSEDYPKYDNYDAINVDKVADIPIDYFGCMGVPITYLSKHNPNQFEIVGNEYDLNIEKGRGYVNCKRMYSRLFIKRKYNNEDYPTYDNYDAINVDKTKDIPIDYFGCIGVPITYLSKHNPNQFEIIESNSIRLNENVPFKSHGLIKDKEGSVNGINKYVRIVIKRK